MWSFYVNIVVRPVANYEACHTAVVAHLQAAIGNKFDQVLAFGTFLFQVTLNVFVGHKGSEKEEDLHKGEAVH